MSLVPGLSPSIRQPAPQPEDNEFEDGDVQIEHVEGEDASRVDQLGNVISIEHPDGSVTISLDGKPLEPGPGYNSQNRDWFDNLLDDIDAMERGRIAEELMRGIEDDKRSRTDWVENRAVGLKLLGLKVELPSSAGTGEGAPVEGMSRVRHPLLLEAVLRFQANARSELLPTDGPVKIRNDDNAADLGEDQLATALERDFNHYLTAVATEYYPDTDRMLLMLGFGGMAFKKVYFCPLRQRPVSETVDASDLIVNESATDLANAKRVTHRIYMKPSTVRRMQILGVYSDEPLSTPMLPQKDALQLEKDAQQGVSASGGGNPEDRDREIYECYCELDIKGYEHKLKGKETGLEIPYRVTIDVSTKKILSIVRNYDEDGESPLPVARENFVKYTFVPGFGFHDLGLLNILGNTTNAVTAAWRELLDSGMFASFPGFLMADSGARQNTNIFRVPPGGGALVKTNGLPIKDAVMPLPYKEPSPALMQLVQNMAETGQRVGGTSEMQVGEGRADAPVGTTLALIEQAMKILNSVHKRMHTAQAKEFELLAGCFRDNPESFWQSGRKKMNKSRRSKVRWNEQLFIEALDNSDLVPQADPNTASHSQRLMKVMALKQLMKENPTLYDPIAVDKAALQAIGWTNPEQFMAPPSAQAEPPPEVKEKMAELQIKKQDADSRTMVAQAKVKDTMIKAQGLAAGGEVTDPMENKLKEANLRLKAQDMDFKQERAAVDDRNRDLDRQADISIEKMKLEADSIAATKQHDHEHGVQHRDILSDHIRHAHELAAQISSEGEDKSKKAPK